MLPGSTLQEQDLRDSKCVYEFPQGVKVDMRRLAILNLNREP